MINGPVLIHVADFSVVAAGNFLNTKLSELLLLRLELFEQINSALSSEFTALYFNLINNKL